MRDVDAFNAQYRLRQVKDLGQAIRKRIVFAFGGLGRVCFRHADQTLLGRVDVRMDVTARDLAHYQEIYRTKILALPHIAEIEALMLVSELKSTDRLPL